MCEISLYVLLVYLRVSSRFSSFIPPAKLFFGVNEYDGKSTLTLPRIKQLISMDNWTRRDHILYACIKSLIWFHEHYFNDDYIVEMQYLFFSFHFFFPSLRCTWNRQLKFVNWQLKMDLLSVRVGLFSNWFKQGFFHYSYFSKAINITNFSFAL